MSLVPRIFTIVSLVFMPTWGNSLGNSHTHNTHNYYQQGRTLFGLPLQKACKKRWHCQQSRDLTGVGKTGREAGRGDCHGKFDHTHSAWIEALEEIIHVLT